MGKRNKIRYHSHGNPYPKLALSGNVYVKYADEDALAQAKAGDLMLFLNSDSNRGIEPGQYDCIGLEGYLKADVHDGRGFKPLSLEEFFTDREYYYGKREMPQDTIAVCRPILQRFKGRTLLRKYREHYVLEEE
jgi:hypothetical protein